MGKFTSGPDWTDVEIFMRALDALHGGVTKVTISTEGIGATGGLTLAITTSFAALDGGESLREVVTSSTWPCKSCGDLAEHLYNGLYKHDFGISEAYQQQKWPM